MNVFQNTTIFLLILKAIFMPLISRVLNDSYTLDMQKRDISQGLAFYEKLISVALQRKS